MNKTDSRLDLLLSPFHTMMDRSLHRKNRRRKGSDSERISARSTHNNMESVYHHISSSSSTFILYIWIFLYASVLVDVTNGADLVNIPKFHFVREPAVSTVTRSGSPATLDCVVAYSGRTKPDIHWIREAGEGQPGIRLDDSSVRYRLRNGSLYFKRVSDPGNTGSYRCGATVPGVGTIVSREAHLDVTYLRKPLQREPTDLALAPGDTAAFECLVEARPQPKVTWYKGDVRVVEGQGRGVHIYPTGLLEIGPLKPTDYNSYSCVVEVPGHSVRSRAAVLSQLPASDPKLRGTPKFVVRPRSQYAVKGESVYLHCVGQGRDGKGKPPVLSWLKDGRMLSPEEHEGRLEMVGAGTLVIKSVTETDQGVYTCRAVNQDDTADADATLTVFVPPEITSGPSNVAVQEKTDLTLTCNAQGVPEPQVTWYKEGIPINSGGNYHQILANGDLLILGVKRVDSGMYQCLASNELEDTQASARLLVYTGDLPHSILGRNPNRKLHHPYALPAEARYSDARRLPPSPHELKSVTVSTRFITVSWEVPVTSGLDSDRLKFSVVWRDVNSERERLDNTTEKQYSMQHLQPNTEYEVRVRAYNSEGPSAKEATLRVRTDSEVLVPSEPLKLAATPISPTEITVTWEPPQQPNGEVTEYELSYYRERGKRELKRRTRKLSMRLRELDEYTKYSIRVAAVNSKGVGLSTPELEAMTFSDRPSEPPRNFTLEVSSSTSLIVRWQPPPQNSQNGIITGYKIRRRRKGDKQKGETVTTSGDRNNYALLDLEKGTEYQVRVAAMTANGTGPHTPWLAAATFSEEFKETRAPDQPAGLSIIVKAHSIDVSWLPPPNNILVREYIIGYGKGIPDVYKKKLEPDVRRYVIENLSPGTLYVLNIQAKNSKGISPQKLETVMTLIKDEEPLTPMSPPLGITAKVLSASTVQLTWSDSSLADNQKIADNRHYTVNYRHAGRKKWRSERVRRQNALIKDLRPFTKYEFCVKVTKGDRESDFSMTVIATTDEKPPSTEPKDVTPAPLPDNPLAISLSWQPPSRPNGRITDYLIYYTTDLHAEDIVWPVEGVEGNSLTTLIDNLTPDTTYYFKVQARNSKGKGPKSKAKKYVTPPAPQTEPTGEKEEEGIGLSLPIIAGACIAIIVLICVFSVGIYYLCKRRSEPSGLTKSPKGPPPQGVKPPDLWTHQPSNLELNKLGRSNRSESSASVATSTIRRGSRGSGDHTDDQGSTLDRRRNSYVGEGGYPSSGEERYQPIQPRNLIRPKPVMMPIDGPGAFRDPMGVPGSGPPTPMLQYGDAPGGPLPMRPIYPRTQYSAQYGGAPYSNPARVNAGDLPHSCPNNGKPLTVVTETDKDGDLPSSMEDSFNSRIGYVKPQPNISPYRKPNAPVTSTPHKGQRTPVNFNSKSPETKLKKEEADLSKSLSTEELTAEMANLEGLMKDLNAITQQEFEC